MPLASASSLTTHADTHVLASSLTTHANTHPPTSSLLLRIGEATPCRQCNYAHGGINPLPWAAGRPKHSHGAPLCFRTVFLRKRLRVAPSDLALYTDPVTHFPSGKFCAHAMVRKECCCSCCRWNVLEFLLVLLSKVISFSKLENQQSNFACAKIAFHIVLLYIYQNFGC